MSPGFVTTASVRLGEPVPTEAMRSIERAMQLRHFKWDTQVGDTGVLFPQPLLLAWSEWDWLATRAEAAARELYVLEQTVAADSLLQERIGVPRAFRKLLRPNAAANNLRTLRFDFHPTATGWLLSEVNADVPGGFGEAGALPALFQPFQAQAALPACPLEAWGAAVATEIAPGHAALLSAPGHLEDQQVVLTLGRELARRGFTPRLIQNPAALRWQDDWACLSEGKAVRLGLVVRFFQAEWLARLPERSGWWKLFERQGGTRVVNPPASVISESKRLPLCFGSDTATLRKLFPECRDLREIGAAEREEWVLKATYANTGDAVHVGAELPTRAWDNLWRAARRNPAGWVAQRRFETVALASARGPLKPCVGVFVVGSRAAGAYVRLSTTQVTNAHAMETPLFIVPDPTPA